MLCSALLPPVHAGRLPGGEGDMAVHRHEGDAVKTDTEPPALHAENERLQ